MAPSRSRSSRLSRPPASQSSARHSDATGLLSQHMRNAPPAYIPPSHPLTDASLLKMGQLRAKYERKRQEANFKKALVNLGSCVYDLNRRLRDSEARYDKEVAKGDDGDEERLARLAGDVEELKTKMDGFTGRMEKHARLCVDLEERWRSLLYAVERSAAAGARPVVGRRGTQSGMGSSFEPTMPDATAGGDEEEDAPDEPQGVSVLSSFKETRQARDQEWAAKSLLERYGNHVEYKEFRAREFEGYHGDEAECPAPHRWFDTPDAQPGTATRGAGDESDDDIQIARAKISTKCPLTLTEFVHPVMSSTCKHTFEKKAIVDMIGRPGQRKQCPVPGCPHFISRSQLTEDDPLLRKIKRIQEGRKRTQASRLMDEDRLGDGEGADTSILLSDGVDEEGFAALDAVAKTEPRTQPTQDESRARRAEMEEDGMDVDDDEDGRENEDDEDEQEDDDETDDE